MATTTISGLTAANAANLTGAAVAPVDNSLGATVKATLAQLRTVMFAGSTGYTATDPLVAGAASFTTLESHSCSGSNLSAAAALAIGSTCGSILHGQ